MVGTMRRLGTATGSLHRGMKETVDAIGQLLVDAFHYLALFAIGATTVWSAAVAFIGMTAQGRASLRRQRGAADVEAQLHRGRELIDVLPARTGRADETFLDVALVDRDGAGDADHSANLHRRARACPARRDRNGGKLR